MWQDLWVALALVLVIEGILPFLNPEGLRRSMLLISQMNNRTLRIAGFCAMMAGVLLLYLVK